MNSFKTSPIANAIAAGCFAAVLASPAAAQFRESTPNLPGTPNDGLVCRSGYTPNFSGSSLKCSKVSEIKVDLACLNAQFPTKVVRAPAGGTPNGEDVCDKPGGVVITSANDISNFAKGSDYVLAKHDDPQIAAKAQDKRQAEASALGVPLGEVEVTIGTAVADSTSGDSTDKSKVPLTMFTFAIKTGSVIGGPGLPATTNATFTPRALPR